jgi:hypothetical protein
LITKALAATIFSARLGSSALTRRGGTLDGDNAYSTFPDAARMFSPTYATQLLHRTFRLGPMLPIEKALGTRNLSNRLVIKERLLYLDLNKNSIQPTRLFEPDDDKGVGAVIVSVVFRPVAVDLDTFDFGEDVR